MSASERPAPATGAGPSENVAAKQGLAAHSRATVTSGADLTNVVPFPLSWARQLIANATDTVPEYGSAEWRALPDDSREKVAACVVAAESWRTRSHPGGRSLLPGGRRAREIAEARRPRPGDHPGGPVQWNREAVAGE